MLICFSFTKFSHKGVRVIVTITEMGSVLCRKFFLKVCRAFSAYEAVFSGVDCSPCYSHVELCKISCGPRLMDNINTNMCIQCPDITVYFHINKIKLHLST